MSLVPIRQLLKIVKGQEPKSLRQSISAALDNLDTVYLCQNRQKAIIQFADGPYFSYRHEDYRDDVLGAYAYQRLPPEITLYYQCQQSINMGPFTLLHELAHYLDQHGLGYTPALTAHLLQPSAASPLIHAWYEVVQQTTLYAQLTNIQDRVEDARDRELMNTFLSPEELFATSYAQYVSEKLQKSDFLEGLAAAQRGGRYLVDFAAFSLQWDADDFATVGAAMEAILRPFER